MSSKPKMFHFFERVGYHWLPSMYYTDFMGLPNCIFILTPHHPCTVWEGNDPKIETPYLRALSLHGTFFSNAYSPIPIGNIPINESLLGLFFSRLKPTMESNQYTSAIVGIDSSIQILTSSFTHHLSPDSTDPDLISSLGDETVRSIKKMNEPFFITLLLPDLPTESQNTSGKRQSIQETDRQIGRILATLSARGFTNNIILYAGLMGEETSQDQNQSAFQDSAIRVPMVISGVSGQQRNTVVKAPVSLSNVIPILHSIIEKKTKSGNDESLLSLLRNPNATQPKYVYLENEDGTKLIRTQRYKLIIQPNTSGGKLYDLQQDSGETKNLYGTPSTMGEQLRLEQLIHEHTKI